MTKLSALATLAAADVNHATDLVEVVDMSEAGVDRNKKMTVAEFFGYPTLTASEAIAAGDFVSIHASAGAKIRKADASDDTRPCHGFVPLAIADAAAGVMIRPGSRLTGLAGLTPGATYYLSTAAGGITDTPPSGGGELVQEVGVAISATELLFNPKTGITL